MAIVGAPQVTPVALQNALLEARRRGPANDPYSLIAAMKSVGDSYNNMNTGLIHANQLAREQAQTDANLGAGVYPAAAEAAASGSRYTTASNQDKLAHLQDLQRAVKETMAEGIQRGDPRFMVSVQGKLQNYSAMKGVQGDVDKSVKRLQTEHMQQRYLEDALPRMMALANAKKAFPAELEKYRAAGQNIAPGSAAETAIWKSLVEASMNEVQQAGLKVQLDPVNGTARVYDNSGMEKIVPEDALAAFYKIGGNPALANLHDQIFRRERETVATNASSGLSGARTASIEAGGTGTIRAGRVGTQGGRTTDVVHNELVKLRTEKTKAVVKALDAGASPETIKQIRDEYDSAIKDLLVYNTAHTIPDPNITTPAPDNSVGGPNEVFRQQSNLPGLVRGVDYAAPGMSDPYNNVDLSGLQTPVITVPNTSDYNPQRAAQTMEAFRAWKALNMPPEEQQLPNAPFFAGSR